MNGCIIRERFSSEDGRVHHVIEQSKDGGETWAPYFDGIYVERGESEAKAK